MKLRVAFILMLVFIGLVSMSRAQSWERLGSRAVNFGLDRDVINVGAHEGAFTKLKVQVTGAPVNMHRVKVEYMNGDVQNLQIKENFSPGSGTRIIDLKGNKRIIQRITFFYDTKNRAKRRAKVHVFGRH